MRITWEEMGQGPRQHRALRDEKRWDLAVGRGVGSDRRSARGLLTHALTLVSPVLHRDGPDSLGGKKLRPQTEPPKDVPETAKETQVYRTVFWTLWERERVG